MGDTWKAGNRVFAYWGDDEYYYPATITDISGDDIQIRWDKTDGGEGWVTSDSLSEMALSKGDPVECYWPDDGKYYEAEVLEVNGEDVRIRYNEDNSESWVSMANIRTWYEDE